MNTTKKPDVLKMTEATKTVDTYHVLVTPEVALELLTANEGNRPVNQKKVEEFASAMRNGLWRDTHQSVAIDEEGHVLDGQHRLYAVFEANHPIWMRVSFGEDRANFSVLDIGAKRQAGQFVTGKNRSVLASAARLLAIMDGTTDAINVGEKIKAKSPSMTNTLASVDRWRPELEAYSSPVVAAYRTGRINTSFHLAVMCMAGRTVHADMVPAWFEGINNGVGLVEDDPRTHLRNRWTRDYKLFSGTQRTIGYITIVKAWNAYATSQTMKALKVGPAEAIPDVIGWKP